MGLELFQSSTGVSGRDLWQKALPPFAHWDHPRWGLLLLLALAGNVVAAAFAWLLMELVMR
jgi:hypothetical protein